MTLDMITNNTDISYGTEQIFSWNIFWPVRASDDIVLPGGVVETRAVVRTLQEGDTVIDLYIGSSLYSELTLKIISDQDQEVTSNFLQPTTRR